MAECNEKNHINHKKRTIETPHIPVFFCTDNNYAVPTYIALYSLLKDYSGNSEIDVFILTSKDFSKNNLQLFDELTRSFKFLNLKTINMRDSYKSAKINNCRITTATMFRLQIPRIVKQFNKENVNQINKGLYFDSDVVINGNIAELYNVDIERYCIAGVRDRFLSCGEYSNLKDIIGIPALDNYINAGVLLMNFEEINKHCLDKELEETGYCGYPYNDQDAINKVFYGRIKVLPLKYNVNSSCLYHWGHQFYKVYGLTNIGEARKIPVVIHYNAWKKPWAYKSMPMAKQWWKYVDIQEEVVLHNYIKPFLYSQKIRLRDKIKDFVNCAIRSHYDYYPISIADYYLNLLKEMNSAR